MSLDKEKCNNELGFEIENYLISLGLQTPVNKEFLNKSETEKTTQIQEHITEIWKILGMDLSDDSLHDTPRRISKMLVKELNWGLLPENFPKCTTVENKMKYDEMLHNRCSINSTCEHHGVYFGTLHNKDLGCWIAYIPKDKVIGLSKLGRIAEYFSARPQIQERLTMQIFETLKYILGTEDVAVVIKAQHFCCLTRGLNDTSSETATSALGGCFRTDLAVRSEFYSLFN